MMKLASYYGGMRRTPTATFPAASSKFPAASPLRSLIIAAATTAILSIFLLAITIVAEGDYMLIRNGECRVENGELVYYDTDISELGGGGSWTVGIAYYEGDNGGVPGAPLIPSKLLAFAVGSVEEFDTARQSSAADEQWVNLRGNFLNIVRIGFAQGNDHRKKEFTTQMAKRLSASYEVAAHPGSGGDGDLMGMVYPIPISASFTAMEAAHMFQMVANEFQKDGFQLFRRVGYRFELCKAFKEGGILSIEMPMPSTPVGAPAPDNGFWTGPTHGVSAMQGSTASSDVSDYEGLPTPTSSSQPSRKRLIKCEHFQNGDYHLKPNGESVFHATEVANIYKGSGGQGSIDWENGVGYFESFDNWATKEMFAFAVGRIVSLDNSQPPPNGMITKQFYVQLFGRFLYIENTGVARGKGRAGPILLEMAKELYAAYNEMHDLAGMVFPVNVGRKVGKDIMGELLTKHEYQLYRLAGVNSDLMELCLGFRGLKFPAVEAPGWVDPTPLHPDPAAIPPQQQQAQQPAMNMDPVNALIASFHQSSGVLGGVGSGGGGNANDLHRLIDCPIVKNESHINGSPDYVPHDQEIQHLYSLLRGAGPVHWVQACACYETFDQWNTHQLFAFAVVGTISLGEQAGQSLAAPSAPPAFKKEWAQLQGQFLNVTFTESARGLDIHLVMAKKIDAHYKHYDPTLAGMLYPVDVGHEMGYALVHGLMQNGFKLYRRVGYSVELYKLFGSGGNPIAPMAAAKQPYPGQHPLGQQPWPGQ